MIAVDQPERPAALECPTALLITAAIGVSAWLDDTAEHEARLDRLVEHTARCAVCNLPRQRTP